MKKFNATLSGANFINVEADRMEVRENMLWVWSGEKLAALVEITAIISAHISERGNNG